VDPGATIFLELTDHAVLYVFHTIRDSIEVESDCVFVCVCACVRACVYVLACD